MTALTRTTKPAAPTMTAPTTTLDARIARAIAKSAEQAAAGCYPYHIATDHGRPPGMVTSQWSVPSRTTGGRHYLVIARRPAGPMDESTISTECECESSGPCWHRAHVRAAMAGRIRYRDNGGRYASAHRAG